MLHDEQSCRRHEVHKDTYVAPISLRRPLLHGLHLTADDRLDNKDICQGTWIHSACANPPNTAYNFHHTVLSREQLFSKSHSKGAELESHSNSN
ncbi:hypothetical protein HanRHA438_Chr07g0313311 [Helianthus annuus]|nr:hypothetical protein HanRHA438_Chr07g0313311 [Helianthus annuus]